MVPQTSGSTPNEACSPANVGDHLVPNRKSETGTSPKNDSVSNSSEPTMQTVVSTDTSEAEINAILTPASKRERGVGVRVRRTPAARDASAMWLGDARQLVDLGLGLLGLSVRH